MGRQICKRIKMFCFFAFGAPLRIYDIIMKNAYLQLIPSINSIKSYDTFLLCPLYNAFCLNFPTPDV